MIFKKRNGTEDAKVLVSHKVVIERSKRIVVENCIFLREVQLHIIFIFTEASKDRPNENEQRLFILDLL